MPTPFHEDKFGEYEGRKYKLADMRAVTSAAEAIVPFLRKGNLVVLESTSPPRTTIELVAPILARSGLQAGRDFHLAYSPERVLPGRILHELIENARVIGGITPESAQAGADLYSIFVKGDIVQTDATTAEMVKLMENTYGISTSPLRTNSGGWRIASAWTCGKRSRWRIAIRGSRS